MSGDQVDVKMHPWSVLDEFLKRAEARGYKGKKRDDMAINSCLVPTPVPAHALKVTRAARLVSSPAGCSPCAP